MKLSVIRFFHICFCSCSLFYATENALLAQVTSDNTVNTQVNQKANVAEITGGETRGDNLFHSFQHFSIPTGNEAAFNNATDITNIFSRVTGGKLSNINGIVRSNGGANLFLINPAGIIFGENASLNIEGSFYGSSASSIIFSDGEFSAIAPKESSSLTISVPIGLNFGSDPEAITVNGGNVNIEADRLRIADLGNIQASTSGSGDAGNLKITTSDIEIWRCRRSYFF